MSNEAKGPYEVTRISGGVGWACVQNDVILDSGRKLELIEYATEIANIVHHHALTSQAARVKELEEALRLVREEARAWREEWRLYNMRGDNFMRPFIYEMNTDANDCLNTPALTPKEPPNVAS